MLITLIMNVVLGLVSIIVVISRFFIPLLIMVFLLFAIQDTA